MAEVRLLFVPYYNSMNDEYVKISLDFGTTSKVVQESSLEWVCHLQVPPHIFGKAQAPQLLICSLLTMHWCMLCQPLVCSTRRTMHGPMVRRCSSLEASLVEAMQMWWTAVSAPFMSIGPKSYVLSHALRHHLCPGSTRLLLLRHRPHQRSGHNWWYLLRWW